MKLIALATFYNRRELTLRSLKSLYQQILPDGCNLSVCIVDDGSTDGTATEVRSAYPDVVVLSGPGGMYWAGGMRFGWEEYVSKQMPDALLVFNDDICLYPNALSTLIQVGSDLANSGQKAHTITGALKDPNTNNVAYSGVIRCSRWHPLRLSMLTPSNQIQECDTLNMNLALISRDALSLIGFLSPEFRHKRADFDFGLRLKRAGGSVVLAPGYLGECSRNSQYGTSKETGISLCDRWHRLLSIKEEPYIERAFYCRRHGGLLWPIWWAIPYISVLLGRRSRTL